MTHSDFGGFPPAQAAASHRIEDLDGLRRIVGDCVQLRRRMRARCFAHSMNGMSVPCPDEALLDLAGVRHALWKGDGVITAGAGLSVWELDRYVRAFGWKLPVINDGDAEAPSVGGFVAAGGIGEGAVFHGGFWESVRALTIVTGTGEPRRVTRLDPLFAWLFGTMGGLGIVFEADIELVPADSGPTRDVASCAHLAPRPRPEWPPHLWLTLFVREDQRDAAIARLMALLAAHPEAWTPRGPYEYFLAHRRFHPPFVFDGDASFVALGVWGDRHAGDHDLQDYFTLESAFQQLVEDGGYRRYFQSELIRRPRDLARYVGTDCAARYLQIKAALDPHGLLNAFMPQRTAVDPAS